VTVKAEREFVARTLSPLITRGVRFTKRIWSPFIAVHHQYPFSLSNLPDLQRDRRLLMRLTAFSRVSKDQHGLRAPSLLSASTLISMILVCAAPYRAVPHSWFAIWFANFGLLLSLLHYIEAVSRNSKHCGRPRRHCEPRPNAEAFS
jgi:hypothetical protein